MNDGRIVLEGAFDGTFDLGCGPLGGTADGLWANLFLAQLSPSGECLWSRAIASHQLVPGLYEMAVGDAGDIALALQLVHAPLGSSIDFGGGPLPTGSGEDPPFASPLAVAKYSADGAFVFARVATGGSSVGAPHVAVTGAGEALLSASYTGTIDLGGGPRGSAGDDRQFVTKLGASGEELWTRDIAAGLIGGGYAFAIATEPGGGFFLAGPGRSGMAILGESVPETTIFEAAFEAGGEPIDVQTFPLPEGAEPGSADALGLSASAPRALVFVGDFQETFKVGQPNVGPNYTVVARLCR